ncbi:MAG TPA: adenylyltransferase/cytidyltransferase family protein [Methanospirillum sp.]|nr:adenylyltransferase/cytidyltransferase family protein [Methanospirillum sp.]
MTRQDSGGRRIVATGTFDLLHPGHLWYLEESARLGDELWVIVARDGNVRHKPKPLIPEEQRVRMVAALKPVTRAVLGDLDDMFRPIEEIQPAVITLGFNQHFNEDTLREGLKARGLTAQVVRVSEYAGSPYTSSRMMVREIQRRCEMHQDSSSC